MSQGYISNRETGCFSNLICNYLDEDAALASFYNRFPKLDNFKAQLEEKRTTVTTQSREQLVEVLQQQYQHLDTSELTSEHIQLLENPNTFTITTGHQLNLFTGPAYFLYKIISTINLCKTLKQTYPDFNFVPVYWMASEDHDFEEINFFNFKGKKVQWHLDNAAGAVGELSLEGLSGVFEVFKTQLDSSSNSEVLKKLFQTAYLEHNNLAEAMRFLVNQLFKSYGLVIVDGNNKVLKQQFVPYIAEELTKQTAYKEVMRTNQQINNLPQTYKIQVNPRAINLFYLHDGIRERIVVSNNVYSVLGTQISWSEAAILKEVAQHPERFSPNVIMRPLYQEVVLPNLCYIGGGGELAYWLQLKSFFKTQQVVFPMLLLRNSVLILSQKQQAKIDKLDVPVNDLFKKQEVLISKTIKKISQVKIDFSPQKQQLQQQFKDLYRLAENTDKSFLGAVAAQERKQIKGLEKLEKRLLKAQKRKLKAEVDRLKDMQNALFPNGSLQERTLNFSELYLEFGDTLIPKLIQNLEPLKQGFLILNIT